MMRSITHRKSTLRPGTPLSRTELRMRWVLMTSMATMELLYRGYGIDIPVCCIIISTGTLLLHVLEKEVINQVTLVGKGGLCPAAKVQICFPIKTAIVQALFRAFDDTCSGMISVTKLGV